MHGSKANTKKTYHYGQESSYVLWLVDQGKEQGSHALGSMKNRSGLIRTYTIISHAEGEEHSISTSNRTEQRRMNQISLQKMEAGLRLDRYNLRSQSDPAIALTIRRIFLYPSTQPQATIPGAIDKVSLSPGPAKLSQVLGEGESRAERSFPANTSKARIPAILRPVAD